MYRSLDCKSVSCHKTASKIINNNKKKTKKYINNDLIKINKKIYNREKNRKNEIKLLIFLNKRKMERKRKENNILI